MLPKYSYIYGENRHLVQPYNPAFPVSLTQLLSRCVNMTVAFVLLSSSIKELPTDTPGSLKKYIAYVTHYSLNNWKYLISNYIQLKDFGYRRVNVYFCWWKQKNRESYFEGEKIALNMLGLICFVLFFTSKWNYFPGNWRYLIGISAKQMGVIYIYI